MRKVLLTTILLSYFSIGKTQQIISNTFTPITVLIKSSTGSSSGVIVKDSSFEYLVTARHCLIEAFKKDSIKLINNSVFLIYYNEDPSSSQPDTLLVDLRKAYVSGCLLFDRTQDIAIIALAGLIGKTESGKPIYRYTTGTSKLTKIMPSALGKDLLFDFEHVKIGDDCFMFGFPSSLQLSSGNDYNFDRPLLRKGIIAGKDKSKNTIIIDCPAYQGNSGGPVFAVDLMRRDDKVGLIGIVSRAILQLEELQSSYYHRTMSLNYSNSGYTVIIPIEFAEKLMVHFRSRLK